LYKTLLIFRLFTFYDVQMPIREPSMATLAKVRVANEYGLAQDRKGERDIFSRGVNPHFPRDLQF
jgi:hypothetical protein